MSFNQAAFILEQHGMQWRASAMPEHIQGRVDWVNAADGTSGADWEDIALNTNAIRDWLGY